MSTGESAVKQTISAYIIAKNEERLISRAIESVQWMDEVIVLDSGSTDNTVEIAEKLGARVSYASFDTFHEQKARAMELCTGDWTFNLDADEEMTPELRSSVESVIYSRHDGNSPHLYRICRKNNYLGRWIHHSGWYPEYRTRLGKAGHVRWEGKLFPEILTADGPAGTLSGDLLHRPYEDFSAHLRAIDRYSRMWSKREADSGRKSGMLNIIFRPLARFLKMYVLRAGFLDWGPGFVVSVMGAFYTFIKYVRLYELSGNNE
ncbi:glycosyltransferase family 2 protein [Candidatus Latescibacterota bacterium]